MPGYLSTPPASPGKVLKSRSTAETQTQTHTNQLSPPNKNKNQQGKATASPSQMANNSLACATWLTTNPDSNPGNTLGLSLVLTPELLAVGELVAAMKRVVGVLGTTFDSLGEQTERVATLAPALKAAEHINKIRAELAQVISESEVQAVEVQHLLEKAVKQTLSDEVKAHIAARVAREVKDRVTHQARYLPVIPEHLRQQIKSHKRQILEVQRSLHNSEARQHNSALGGEALTTELRPLLRPLPSAEQSPMPRSMPPTPLPLPISREASIHEAAPTPSPLFPRDLKALFALRSEEAETLVKEYGLGEHAPPVTPIVAPAAEADFRERNLNRFMAHIGVSRRRVPNARLPQLHVVIPGSGKVAVNAYY
ncbi:hypothetical protein K438DRAFT_1977800 [Mycena galopus ATCC 62051]|nr:hypothetical protein K438DRAFT_1977800 [Mycena galopus ATCC 62051]